MSLSKFFSFIGFSLISGVWVLFGLTGCDQGQSRKFGHFTIQNPNQKLVTNVNALDTHIQNLIKKIDPHVVYLECAIKSQSSTSACYEKNIKTQLENLKVDKKIVLSFIQLFPYSQTKLSIENISKDMILRVQADMNTLIEKRKNYCLKHSHTKTLHCLKDNLTQESVGLINSMDQSSSIGHLTGLEYLYLKKRVESKLEKAHLASFKSIQSYYENQGAQGLRAPASL